MSKFFASIVGAIFMILMALFWAPTFGRDWPLLIVFIGVPSLYLLGAYSLFTDWKP